MSLPERINAPAIVAVFNHKGGVGKTTTAGNVAVCLAAFGYRVVLVDLDAQGNATGSFGVLPLPPLGAYDVITGQALLEEALLPTPFPNLQLLPATTQLRMAELQMDPKDRSPSRLREALSAQHIENFAQVTVIDCPPALGSMTANALEAAAAVLIPAKPDPYTHEGLVNTWDEIKRLRSATNHKLAVAGVLLTMTGAEDETGDDVARAIRAEFGKHVYAVEVASDPKVTEAAQHGVPVCVMDPDGKAGLAYVQATAELIRRLRGTNIHAALPEPADLPDALNSLREWRLEQITQRRLPRKGQAAWTAVGQANPDAVAPEGWAPSEDDEDPPEPKYNWLALAVALALGLAAGFAAGRFF